MASKEHGNRKAQIGNKNAARDESAKAIIQIRCREKDKVEWQAAAESDGLSLSQYIISRLRGVAK